MTSHHAPSRRAVLRGGAATLGLGTLAVMSVRELASGAVAAVPTASSTAALNASTACATLTKEETQGPFWVDEKLNRSDVRADSATGAIQSGVPLTLTINLQDAGASCAPQVGAYVDIWHANAQGAYSDVSGSGNPNNVGVDWLRGYQVSDENGSVTFTTIWPGWYVSRTIHIHFRVRLALDSSTTVNFTSQIFFDETNNAKVLATSAYQKSGTRDTTNAKDNLYDSSLLLPVTGSVADGYAGTFTVNLDFGDGDSDGGTTPTASATTDPTSTPTASPTSTPTTDPTTTPTDDPTATATPILTPADTVVAGRVQQARIVRRMGRRVVEVKLRSTERVATKVRLVRHDDVLASKTWGWMSAGSHTLRMPVPRDVTAGNARVVVNLADRAGNTKISRTQVFVVAK